ncbi:Hypothetical predicted protein [Scomber scombrus]|uniref:Uncharacterized protein n=1 Tax=Scomber scombrus TaxID=13677 RepID=A0AAV1PDS6_SCOSC
MFLRLSSCEAGRWKKTEFTVRHKKGEERRRQQQQHDDRGRRRALTEGRCPPVPTLHPFRRDLTADCSVGGGYFVLLALTVSLVTGLNDDLPDKTSPSFCNGFNYRLLKLL